MAKTSTAGESTAGEPTSEASATLAPAEPRPVASTQGTTRKSRWVLPAIAGAGLLSLGLLGGILIGQNVDNPGGHDRGPDARILIEHQQSGQREQLNDGMRERLHERVRERLQDIRDGQKPGTGQQTPDQPTPSTPAPDEEG